MFLVVHTALGFTFTLPVTTYTTERIFSTLRRVKTLTSKTLNDLCMISIHKEYAKHQKSQSIEEIINDFKLLLCRLELLFDVLSLKYSTE